MKPRARLSAAGLLGALCLTFAPAHAQQCAPVPAGLVSWWRGETNMLDSLSEEEVTLQLDGPAGPDYTVQRSADLASWEDVTTQTPETMPLLVIDPLAPGVHRRFYRLLIGP